MATPDLTGKRVLLLGAETELGAEIARALAEAGASLALIAASNDPQTAFAVQRLARRLGVPISQAIDAENEMAVRVMVRQVSKDLGGLNAIIWVRPPLATPTPSGEMGDPKVRAAFLREMERLLLEQGETSGAVLGFVLKYGGRELDRGGGGPLVVVAEHAGVALFGPAHFPPPKWWLEEVSYSGKSVDRVVGDVLRSVRSRGLWWKFAKRTPKPLLPLYRFLAKLFAQPR